MLRLSRPARILPMPATRTDAEHLNVLPYGVIVVDLEGKILAFNNAESRATGFSPERVIGRNFFTEVAPCTQVGAFAGRFEKFASGVLGEIEPFEFTFPFATGAQRVTILFSREARTPNRISIIVLRETQGA